MEIPMSDEATTATAEETTATETEAEKSVPYERFQKVNQQAKEAKAQATQLAKDMADLKAQMEERETAGLPELERERKRAEQLEKRANEAEAKAAEADTKLARTTKERWVTAAASSQNFADPSDASAFVNLDDIEDEKDAERAVKRLAAQKKHLLKSEEPKLPGQILKDGRPVDKKPARSLADEQMAQVLSDGLKQFATKQ
jgi:hypothetical protein